MPTPTPTPLAQALQDNATGPERAQGDTGSVEQHPLPDQIAADRHLASQRANRSKDKGIQLTKFISAGTV